MCGRRVFDSVRAHWVLRKPCASLLVAQYQVLGARDRDNIGLLDCVWAPFSAGAATQEVLLCVSGARIARPVE